MLIGSMLTYFRMTVNLNIISAGGKMTNKEIIDRIFKDPNTKYELTEFENLGKPIDKILEITQEVISGGKEVGKTKYYLKSIIPFVSGKTKVSIYDSEGKSAPEEIVRQLWVYKLINQYDYKADEIDLEKSVQFGTEVGTKAADIIVYTDSSKETPKIIIECKKPKRKDGIEQLKSYMNAKGAPVAVWSNGCDSIILYRPYPKEFNDTLYDIPKRGQEPKDVLEAKKTILQLRTDFNFKKIVQDLEELVLADSGKDEFNEIFKLIFAKIWDEKEALENRRDKTVEFNKSIDPDITYDRINGLFQKASAEWPGIFKPNEEIELTKRHLQVCVGPIEGVRLLGSNLRIMDDAFEYLLPTESKKKKGQFFTPRHVVEMCVRMLNPKRREYVLDPACGSGGFLLHTMDWCYPAADNREREDRKHRYASKYLWGIDFEQRAAKTSRALMLIAGDGHTNIFGPDVNSLDPRTWFETASGQQLMTELRKTNLTAKRIPDNVTLNDEDKAWEYFDELLFDVILANPPFAGEIKDRKMLSHYELAKIALNRAGDDKPPKVERDVLFIERIVKMLKPGGRAAIVLPQGKLNNSSLSFIRDWMLKKARLLAVVGLHQNTFKPHTGTKTSVVFLQKYTQEQLNDIDRMKDEVKKDCPPYDEIIKQILLANTGDDDVKASALSPEIQDFIDEIFSDIESSSEEDHPDEDLNETVDTEDTVSEISIEEEIDELKSYLSNQKSLLLGYEIAIESLIQKNALEVEAIKKQWNGSVRDLNTYLKPILAGHKAIIKSTINGQKQGKKAITEEIKRLEMVISRKEYEQKTQTVKGKLEIVLNTQELLDTLSERWVSKEISRRLDYPIFMAVSERGGKNNSGNYDYVIKDDVLIEFPEGHAQAGQPIVDQDLVDFTITPSLLETQYNDDELTVAELFIRYAKQNHLDFWE